MKQTNGALKTTIVGAIVNIVLNFVFIKMIGMHGAALATMISFAVTWLYRAVDTTGFVHITYRVPALIVSILLLVTEAILMIEGWEYATISGLFVCFGIAGLYRHEVRTVWTMGTQLIKKKQR